MRNFRQLDNNNSFIWISQSCGKKKKGTTTGTRVLCTQYLLRVATELASDKATAQKRIWAFLKLCAKFIPCEHETYDLAVGCLDAEVDDDVAEARKILKTVQETCLTAIVQAQRNAVSVLQQVLYFLHQGHVQFLMGDFRARVLDAHGADAFPKAPRPGAVAIVHVRDIRSPAPNNKQAEVDMNQEGDDESTDTKDSGSSPHYTSGGDEDQAPG